MWRGLPCSQVAGIWWAVSVVRFWYLVWLVHIEPSFYPHLGTYHDGHCAQIASVKATRITCVVSTHGLHVERAQRPTYCGPSRSMRICLFVYHIYVDM